MFCKEFLSDVLGIILFKCDVHGGFTADLILEFMKKPIIAAKNTPNEMIWVFLDEVNTSPEVYKIYLYSFKVVQIPGCL